MISNMMEQLQSMKQKMEETKERLDQIIVEGEAGSGTIKVKVNGNKVVKNVSIDPMLFDGSSREEMEDLLAIALNRALEKAEKVHELEMQHSAKDFIPGFNM